MNIQKNRICRFAAVISVVMMTLLWAGSANADLIGFSPDGSGGAPYSDVTGFDWAPGNTLAQGGNAAIATFINSATSITERGGAGASGIFDFFGGTQSIIDVVYQSELTGISIASQTPDVAPTDEITFVFGFQEKIKALSIDTNDGTADVSFDFVPGGTNFFEIWADKTPKHGCVSRHGVQ